MPSHFSRFSRFSSPSGNLFEPFFTQVTSIFKFLKVSIYVSLQVLLACGSPLTVIAFLCEFVVNLCMIAFPHKRSLAFRVNTYIARNGFMHSFMVLKLTQKAKLHPTSFARETLVQVNVHVFVQCQRWGKQLVPDATHHWLVSAFIMFV